MRSWIALFVGALLTIGSACSPTPPPTAGGSDDIAASREALGDPMVKLAESVIALANGMDEARHRVARGEDMQEAIKALRQRREAVAAAAAAARDAVPDAPDERAGAIVTQAAKVGDRAVRDARAELAFLESIADIDRRLLDAAAAWDEPGSQSEIRERLGNLAVRVARLRAQATALRPQPRQCGAMKANRRQWIETVRMRTLRLQANANSASGSEYDRLRSSYRALPFAEEPRAADRKDRACWLENSSVAAAADEIRSAVEELRQSLSG